MVLQIGDQIKSIRQYDVTRAEGKQITGLILEILTPLNGRPEYKINWDEEFTQLKLPELYQKEMIQATEDTKIKKRLICAKKKAAKKVWKKAMKPNNLA